MPDSVEKYDVVIVGGSMVGATLAALLSNDGIKGKDSTPLKVALIEPQTIREPNLEQFEPRVSAISLASENIFRSLDVWDSIVSYRVSRYSSMDVWDDDGTGSVQFDAQEAGYSHLGHIIENQVIVVSLWKKLREEGKVTLFDSRKLHQFKRVQDRWLIELNDQTKFETELLVGADGAQSMVRNQIGFALRAWDYHHTGIVTTIETELPHDRCARQNFLKAGPLALLPLYNQGTENQPEDESLKHCSIVWSCTEERAKELLSMDDENFCAELTQASERRLGKVVSCERRFSFPLKQQHAVRYIDVGVALIGDAAHTIHPLAGQGVNIGLLDAAVLAEELVKARQHNVPIQKMSILRRYERRRKGHNLLTMGTMEGFKRLFALDPMPARLIRNTGMKIFNQNQKLKHTVLLNALGLAGDIPASAAPQPAQSSSASEQGKNSEAVESL